MNITLDHNCIIHLIDETEEGRIIRSIVANENYKCFSVNIGASEMLRRGVFPDNYLSFDALLQKAGIHHLARLNPMAILDVTFWNHCVLADDKMIAEADKIKDILFSETKSLQKQLTCDRNQQKERNRLCDIHSMWCHIHYGNDVFMTTDKNFHKETKKNALVEIGARRICRPSEIGLPQSPSA